jgi:integrase
MAVKKHPSGYWQARWRDENGKQRAKFFDTKKAAENHVGDVTANIRRGTATAVVGKITTVALSQQWIDAGVHLAHGTIQTYERDLRLYILPTFGDLPVNRLTGPAIQRWIATELKRLAPSSVHRHYRTLRTLLGYAVNQGYLLNNPCDKVNAPRIPRREMETFTVDQIEGIAAAVNPRYRCFILIAAYGGLRWSELVGLRRMDITGARLTVAGQLLNFDGEWVRSDPKTSAGRRTLILPESVAEELAQHLATFTGPKPHDLVFTNQQGNPVGVAFRWNTWYPACASIGMGMRTIKNYKPAYANMPRFHDLRHTSVALAIAAGAHPKAIQQRLGHSSIAVTMDRYGHLMAGMDEDLAADIDALRKK